MKEITALAFDGNPWSYVEVNSRAISSIIGALTVECWACIETNGKHGACLFVAGELQKDWTKGIQIWDGLLSYWTRKGSIDSKAIKYGQWMHLAITCDDSSRVAKFYVNGELVDIKQSPYQLITNYEQFPFYVGGYWPTWGASVNVNSAPFKGKLAEVRIWKTVRTAEQIKANYNIEVDTKSAGLVACYRGTTDACGCQPLNLSHQYWHTKDERQTGNVRTSTETIPFVTTADPSTPPIDTTTSVVVTLSNVRELFAGRNVVCGGITLCPDESLTK